MIVCYVIAIIAVLAYGVLCHRENQKRAVEMRDGGVTAADQDWLDLTDGENRAFKYTT
jgi:hypothetical protein